MKSILSAAAAALLLCAAPAEAAKKSAKGSYRAVVIECMKQYGAWYDAATKRWTMRGPYYHMASRADAVDRCVAQKTGQPIRAVMQAQTVRY